MKEETEVKTVPDSKAGGATAGLPNIETAARAFAEAVAATSQYTAFAEAQRALEGDAETQNLLRKYTDLQRRFGRGGIIFMQSEDRAEYERTEEALSQNPFITRSQDAQVKLVRLFRELNQVVSDEAGTNFARATAPGGSC